MTPDDLAQLFDRPVIITPLSAPAPPDAVVFWNANNEGFVIQPLHTALDRAAHAKRMEQIRVDQTERNTECQHQ